MILTICMKCILCKGSLRKIGIDRKNGKTLQNHNGKDWEKRQLHKKCWKILKEEQDLIWTMPWGEEREKLEIEKFKKRYGLVKLL